MAAERVRRFLDEHGVPYEADVHPRAVDAQRLAATEHVSGWMIAKPVMVDAQGELIMLVIPGPAQVDLDRASQVLGCDVRLADEQTFASRFPDCEPGAEPPFGVLYDVSVIVDPILKKDEEILFRAGTHDTTIRVRTEDYLRVARAEEAPVAVLPA